MADISQQQVVDYLSNLPVIQIAELIKTLEDKWGVKAAPVAVAGPAAAAPAAAAAVEDQLATMPGKDELRSKLLATLQAPLQQFVMLLNAPAQNFVYVLAAKESKG